MCQPFGRRHGTCPPPAAIKAESRQQSSGKEATVGWHSPHQSFPWDTEWLKKATVLTIALPQRDKEVRWKIIRSKGVLWSSWKDSALKGGMHCETGDLVGSQTSQRTLGSQRLKPWPQEPKQNPARAAHRSLPVLHRPHGMQRRKRQSNTLP